MDPTKLTLLKGLDVPRGQGDPDLVDLGGTGTTGLVEFVLGVVHVDLFLVFLSSSRRLSYSNEGISRQSDRTGECRVLLWKFIPPAVCPRREQMQLCGVSR